MNEFNNEQQLIEKKSKSKITIIFISVLLIVLGIFIGVIGYKAIDELKKDKETKVEQKDVEQNEKESLSEVEEIEEETIKIEGIKKEYITLINNYIIDNTLSLSNYGEPGNQDILHNLSSGRKNLLADENFKFAFAFILGTKIYGEDYKFDIGIFEGKEEEVSGGVAISKEAFEKIYSHIYGEEYSFTNIPNGTNNFTYIAEKETIYGSIYTGYIGTVNFKFEESNMGEKNIKTELNKIEEISNGYTFDEIEVPIGTIEITFTKNIDEYYLTGLYIYTN